jgi:hypothetical protein
MQPHPTFGGDPSGSGASPAGVLCTQADEASGETNLTDLLASFAVPDGGGLPPQLSVLALEIVLNEILAQACLATSATGAAVLTRRGREMVCRASFGSTAPQVGDRLDASFKLYADCVSTRQTQRCDCLAEPQGNVEALRRLDVRSVILMPLFQSAELVGVFELLSSRSSAFGEREERTLQELVCGTVNELEQATASLEAESDVGLIAEPDPERPKDMKTQAPRHIDSVTWALGLVVLVCLLSFGVLVARRFGLQRTTVHTSPPAPPPVAAEPVPAAVVSSSRQEHHKASARQAPLAKLGVGSPVTPGGLVVFENGKEVFRLPPVDNQAKSPTTERKAESHGDANQ